MNSGGVVGEMRIEMALRVNLPSHLKRLILPHALVDRDAGVGLGMTMTQHLGLSLKRSHHEALPKNREGLNRKMTTSQLLTRRIVQHMTITSI